MPFLFPKTSQLVNGSNGQIEQNQSNIFEPNGAQSLDPKSGDGQTQVNQGGALNRQADSIAAGSGSQTQTAQGQTVAPAKTSADLMSKNSVDSNQGFASKIAGSLETADKSLQDEANTYKSGIESQNFNLDDATVRGAAQGGKAYDDTFSRINQTLAPQQAAYEQKTDLNTGAANLKDESDIKAELRRQADSQYNAGEADLDSALLGRNTDFQAKRQALVDKQNGVQAQADQYKKDLPEWAKTTAQTKWDAGTKAAKDLLGSEGAALSQKQAQEAAELNAARQAKNWTPVAQDQGMPISDLISKTMLANRANSALTQQYNTLAGSGYSKYLAPVAQNDAQYNASVDPSQFLKVHSVTGNDMIDANEAAQFNRINTLLGNTTPTAAAIAGPEYTFDKDAYQGALSGAWNKANTSYENSLLAAISKAMSDHGETGDPRTWLERRLAPGLSSPSQNVRDVKGDVQTVTDKASATESNLRKGKVRI